MSSGTLCYRLGANDERMRPAVGTRTADAISVAESDSGYPLYGQYLPLPGGRYTVALRFHPDRPCRGTAWLDVCCSMGRRLLAGKSIDAAQLAENGMAAVIEFSSIDDMDNVEVRFRSDGGFTGEIKELEIVGTLWDATSRVELADFPDVPIENTLINRRSLYDGYRRGVGLQFTDLAKKIARDPDYREARELAGDRTILGEWNLWNFFLILKFYMPRLASGHIVEFGSYKGGAAIFLASLARRFLPGCRILAFDTFGGMPPTDREFDHHQPGGFADVDLAELRQYASSIGLDNLEFVQGNFADTTAASLARIGNIAFAHIDCDIRSAIECAYDTAKPHMVSGGYWILDDPMVADCLGAAAAMEDLMIRRDGLNSEQVFPHYVFRQP